MFKNAARCYASFLLFFVCNLASAGPIGVDLGVAKNYSGFFFGNVEASNDVEGKLAVGGNYTGAGSIGYRNPYGSTGPSLVVGGNAKFTSNGGVFNGPTTNVDTNQGYGPTAAYQYKNGYGTYGGSLSGNTAGMTMVNEQGVVDFNKAALDLRSLSRSLGGLSSTGSTEQLWGPYSDTVLTGTGRAGALEVFNLSLFSNTLRTLDLKNVADDAFVIINILGAGDFSATGAFNGLFEELEGRVLFNFEEARSLSVNTFIHGGILAPWADLKGWGHIEGTAIAQSMSSPVELGYAPWKYQKPQGGQNAVPEPGTFVLTCLAGLAFLASRRMHRKPR